ncbi:MAG: alkaline phosphatase [Pseudomonadota bacterium]
MKEHFTIRTTAMAAVCALMAPSSSFGATAENVILMISDGASWGSVDMASYWEFGEKGRQPYDDFSVKLGMTTEPYSNPQRVYDPETAWDTTPTGDDDFFAGYKTIKQGATDSAAAGTALSTGVKTSNGRISSDPEGNAMPFITQEMKASGRSTGVVSSVGFSHATPAAFGAQNERRNDYHAIANQMINEGTLDLIMGGGNPNFDDNGQPLSTPEYNWLSEEDWTAVNAPDGPMTLIQTKTDFEALADGSLEVNGRLIGLPEIRETLQASRDPLTTPLDPNAPGSPNLGFPIGHELLPDVPTLATMTTGALNHLGKDEDGLFLMVEGGAVDWMAHANATGRVIEEQIDFNHAVGAAVDWVTEYSSWEETLLVVLTDHGNGAPMGPNSDTIPFEPIENNGQGNLPGVLWHSGSHTTENTLLWANGAGSEEFLEMIVGQDPYLTSMLGFNDGSYIDITGVNPAIRAAAGLSTVTPVPLPAAGWLLLAGVGVLAGLRRRGVAEPS